MKALWRLTKILYWFPSSFIVGIIAILFTIIYPITYVLFGINIYRTWGLKVLEIECKISTYIKENGKCANK